VAVNLKDCAPFASEHRIALGHGDAGRWQKLYDEGVGLEQAGTPGPAAKKYAAAGAIDDRFADLQFRWARCLAATNHFPEAKEHYVLAWDLDALRFRADSEANEVVRRVAADLAGEGVLLADAEQAFADASPHGIPGEELFFEHVHYNFDGGYVLAKAVFDKAVTMLPEAIRSRPGPVEEITSRDKCAAALALTQVDECDLAAQVLDMTGNPPFTGQIEHEADQLRRTARCREQRKALMPEVRQEGMRIYRNALDRRPDDWMLHARFAFYLLDGGHADKAVSEWREVLARVPGNAKARVQMELGVVLVRAGRLDEGVSCYEESLRLDPTNAETHLDLGAVLIQQDKPAEAVPHLEAALRYRPEYPNALVNLGLALAKQGKIDEGIAKLRQALQLKPDAFVYVNLAGLLVKQGKQNEAEAEYRHAIALDPGDVMARNNLGTILAAKGALEEAAVHLEEATRLRPEYLKAQASLAEVLISLGRVQEGVGRLRKVVELAPDSPAHACRLAWVLATSRDDAVRSPAEALRLAQAVSEKSGGKNPRVLDVLGAAQAASGRFEEAAQTADQAAKLARAADQAPLADMIEKHAASYRAKHDLREP
jgi:tetratricopeptide (TPR) repeat protein